jgi:hypothetical protein
MVGKAASTYTVTGITIADILKYYAPDIKPAALIFKESSASASATVYNCSYGQNKGYDWSDAMLIWSQLDGTGAEKISSGIKSAVNGGSGKMWWSGITSVTKAADAALVIKDADGLTSDRFVSLDQLKEHGSTTASGGRK